MFIGNFFTSLQSSPCAHEAADETKEKFLNALEVENFFSASSFQRFAFPIKNVSIVINYWVCVLECKHSRMLRSLRKPPALERQTKIVFQTVLHHLIAFHTQILSRGNGDVIRMEINTVV